MILVDTNIGIDHLRQPDPMLAQLLEGSQVLMHPTVLGKLACGTFKNRAERLRSWRRLPRIEARNHDEVIDWIESERLASTSIGFIDDHLLRAVVVRGDARLWTGDGSLHSLAACVGAAFH